MNSVEPNFQSFLNQHHLHEKKVVLMVSGGVDSMVLLSLCSKFLKPENITVLHINHNTRLNCQKEAELVKEICTQNNITFVQETLEKVPSKNQEQFWRTARQKAAETVKKQTQSDIILTAHHATDLIETVLFRITKGGGLKSFCPFETKNKPLWNISKQALINYAQAQNILWYEDETNHNTKFARNKIRQQVLPTLKEITPNLEKVFVTQAQNLAEYADYIKTQVPSYKKVPLKEFLQWHVVLQKEWLKKHAQHNFSAKELHETLHWLTHNPAGNTVKIFSHTTLKLEKNQLFFIPQNHKQH
ncbi:tRNA lysidine(34) synthetase TilS [bacterium DOLZORAL124_38_8]|nr:MAG: tRNA lysidine(34) synthetase TilS [bacterium DOLZORAL124_38_8]